eukprot:11414727-Prorocentrum_lima.AAC.1
MPLRDFGLGEPLWLRRAPQLIGRFLFQVSLQYTLAQSSAEPWVRASLSPKASVVGASPGTVRHQHPLRTCVVPPHLA